MSGSPTQAQSGFGTLFQIGDGATPEVFNTVAEVTSITAPDSTLATVDATHMESPDGYAEYIPTLLDSGECSLDLNFVPASPTQKLLADAHFAKRKANFRIIVPGAANRVEFAGYVTKLGRTFPHDNKMVQTSSVKATGKVGLVPNP